MSSLSILALLLLLLAHRTPPAQGHPLLTTYITLIKEMGSLLSQPPALPKGDLGINHKLTLQDRTLLRPNLEKFLDAAKNFENKTQQIRKILPEFRKVVPTAPSTNCSISFEENDWDDFRRKLKEYLDSLRRFVNDKIFRQTTRSSSGP
ncbi:interleukin 3 [Phyllostomus discolor]|uniref:Interleukin-3 n=1 Tax=Phyllostomus discolor TaxID=89673 RepID=A0A6J2N3G9_9CHIR|nr:interleukin-3 [Phyllostomus discolor]KAF6081479.1 interleukin 3 [Phyllostomus discolor]